MMMAMTEEPPAIDPMEMLIFTLTVGPDEREDAVELDEEGTWEGAGADGADADGEVGEGAMAGGGRNWGSSMGVE